MFFGLNDVAFLAAAAAGPALTDPFFSNVSLLLKGEDSNIIDSSVPPKSITAIGSAATSTTQARFGNRSIYFDNLNSYLQVTGSSTPFAMGTGDWTVEFWIYHSSRPTTQAGARIFDTLGLGAGAANAIRITINASGAIVFLRYSINVLTSSITVPLQTWTHICCEKSNAQLRMFIGGQLAGSLGDTADYICGTNRPLIGVDSFDEASSLFNGYIDEMRVTKGIARYQSAFSPPTAPFPDA
jgi:hypothetical protein